VKDWLRQLGYLVFTIFVLGLLSWFTSPMRSLDAHWPQGNVRVTVLNASNTPISGAQMSTAYPLSLHPYFGAFEGVRESLISSSYPTSDSDGIIAATISTKAAFQETTWYLFWCIPIQQSDAPEIKCVIVGNGNQMVTFPLTDLFRQSSKVQRDGETTTVYEKTVRMGN
jgi:hypothetical protein